jgi:hypothetical protein
MIILYYDYPLLIYEIGRKITQIKSADQGKGEKMYFFNPPMILFDNSRQEFSKK